MIEISWDRFVDDAYATRLGYADNIKGYSYAIGSQPNRDDIQKYRSIGLSRHVVADVSNTSDGSMVYVSVKGSDHAGFYDVSVSPAFVVDTSPPTVGEIYVGTEDGSFMDIQTYYLTSTKMCLRFVGFEDKHSGLSRFRVGIGSSSYTTDILPSFDCTDDMVTLNLNTANILDGHHYYVIVQAVNRAGLESHFQTKLFRVDRSPPSGGHVLDGPSTEKNDVDFQHDLNTILGHWKGFTDIHSEMAYYKVGLGTAPYLDNTVGLVNVGLTQEKTWHGSFDLGQKYYILVEACNTAGICTRLSSDGVRLDNSPPVQGLVRVGSSDRHQKFLPHSSAAHVHWEGFNDPHSGMNNYKMCIGTQPGLCDTLPFTQCLLRSNIIKTGLNLPANTDLFATVLAVNKAGLNISQTSDSFRIDETAPELVRKPSFIINSSGKHRHVAQWEKSILTINWEFKDDDSPIVMHEVTLKTHHEGHTPVENIRLGAENNLTINLGGDNWLHNGDKYIAVVTSCNMAGLCTTGETDDLLIDSTPPHTGGFKPPLLWRYIPRPDKTLTSAISVTWYGFYDHESDIDAYFIVVSRFYSGDELSNGVVTVNPEANKHEHNATIILSEILRPDDQIILTIWATNTVGLNSSLARISVNAIQSVSSRTANHSKLHGILEIEKHSCDIQYCNKDCTCAAFGKPCVHIDTNTTCKSLNVSDNTLSLPLIEVFTGLHGQHTNITSSSACLSGSWIKMYDENTTQSILRYEWSLGLHNQPIGDGIYDLKHEMPWKDIGLRNEVVHCLPVNRSLIHGHEYVIYTRAWFSANTYATYQSDPITIDQSPPSIRKGKSVIDSDSTCSYDLDIIDWSDTITACWQGVFSELQGRIVSYTFKMGTSKNADDVLVLTNVDLATRYTLSNLSLSQDTLYFLTVTAYNNAGLHTTTSSDGFVIDIDAPIAGTVYNSLDYKHRNYQFNTKTMSISFQGFQDDSSGIRYFFAAISNNTEMTYITSPFTNIGMRTQHTFSDLNLHHGHTYYAVVKAVDNAGHWSSVTMSKSIVIDTTPPRGIACQHFYKMAFESTKTVGVEGVSVLLQANLSKGALYTVSGTFSAYSEARVNIHMDNHVLILPVSLNHDGRLGLEYTFIPSSNIREVLVHVIGQHVANSTIDLHACDDVIEDNAAAITVRQVAPSAFAVNIATVDEETGLNKVEVGAGTTPVGFQIQPLTPIHSRYMNSIIHARVPHGSSFHVTVVVENKARLRSVFNSKPLVVDHTPPGLEDVTVLQRQNTTDMDNTTVTYTVLDTQWEVKDVESDVKYCFCYIGSEPGLSNVQPLWTAQTRQSCSSDALYLNHGQKAFVSVRCVNGIQLHTTVLSEPVIISLQSSRSTSAKLSVIPLNEVSAKHTLAVINTMPVQSNRSCVELMWEGFHDPSGIDYYEYRIMHKQNSVADWTRQYKHHMAMDCNMNLKDGQYTADVRAINSGQYISDSITALFRIAGSEPKLTGRPISITRNGRDLVLNWRNVFSTMFGVPVSFEVVVGTKSGFSNIEDLHYTSGYGLNISVPERTIITPYVQEVYVRVECMYGTGQFATYRYTYKF